MLFKDDYFFLSNFYPCNVSLVVNGEEITFKNVEAAFQSQKNILLSRNFALISGWEAKKLGKQIPLTTANWDTERLFVMAKALHSKFSNRYLLIMLKAIKEDIVEDNYWNDTFWGCCKGQGKNMLGKMLMNIRDNNNDLQALLEFVERELIPNV